MITTSGRAIFCCLLVVVQGGAWGQSSGPLQRVPNTSLKLPLVPPVNGYTTTNAFGSVAFVDPLAIVSPPGETNRLFIVEQRGRIAVITNLASPNRTVFLDISSRVVGGVPTDERGLLGLAFHPSYATNGYFFVYYTRSATTSAGTGDHQQLSRFQVSPTNPNVAATEEVSLLTMRDEAVNHNGGCLQFGPDGYLYVSLGDEGQQNDTLQNSQRIDKDFWSSILRLDVDSPFRPTSLLPHAHPANTNEAGGAINYRIPPDNPFVDATSFNGVSVNPNNVRTEFYAVGLRNPWRFSFDPATGMLYCGDVGQDLWEEVDIIVKGGNYGWAYRDGTNAGPRSASAPAGFSARIPIQTYRHGSATNQGNSVTGGVVYRGDNLPQLKGAYVFGDYLSGHIWALRYDGTNTVPFVRLTSLLSVAAFGVDPRNGDVLLADQGQDRIKRLIYTTTSGTQLPPTLADTGAFVDPSSLTPNPGIVHYDLNVPFWSDNANKTRWFSVPDTNATIGFSVQGNWSLPVGTIWIKHFELELTNGLRESARRLETRFIVRNANGVYGATYRWGDSSSNATLVSEAGLDEAFAVYDGGTIRTQIWHYPSRTECLQCHTVAGGLAVGFNTAQLNRDVDYGGTVENQIAALTRAGYFSSGSIGSLYTLPALAHPTNTAYSRDYRVHSYLAANCSQCHQLGVTAFGQWDGRLSTPLATAGIINGALNNNYGDPNNRVIKPGSLTNSIILTRISTLGNGRMPQLDSSVLDTTAINLLSDWITTDLASYQSFADWQVRYFGSTSAPEAAAGADFDHDGAVNYLEYLTGTDPTRDSDLWKISVQQSDDKIQIHFLQIANRGFEVQWTSDLSNVASWQPLDTPANQPFFSATNFTATIEDVLGNAMTKLYRVRVFEH
ncbi:MAG: hypothetical protein DME26_03710 [Verrucomicrobia bacterium]|nr:MAG: hypothetical protein DME26_03710 [Verrucomicrobiota bacterium]